MLLGGANSVWAQQANSVTLPTGDTWVRTDNPTANYGLGNTVEMQNNTNGTTDFYGVMQFSFDAPKTGYRVKSATLRLTTRFKKGDSQVKIYALNATVTDDSNYNGLETAITSALSNDPIVTFNLNGYIQWAPTDGAVVNEDGGAAYRVVSGWQNTIDLTSYVKGLATNSFAILLEKTYSQNNSSQVFSKEATDIKLYDNSATFEAADLVPQLTVTYEVDPDVDVRVLNPSIDGWFRDANSPSSYNYTNGTLETRYYQSGESVTRFYGVMKFAIPTMAGYEVESATLRLVTERVKSNTSSAIYNLGKELSSSDNYSTIGTDVESALSGSAIGTFTTAGQDDKSIAHDAVSEGYQEISAWTNNISLSTAAVSGISTLSIVIAPTIANGRTQSTNYFTSNVSDVTNSNISKTFSASDLVPQLTIVYRKMANYELTVGSYGAATLSLPFDATIPDGVTCYTLNYTSGDKVTATEVTGGTLSANTPVLVNATTGNYEFTRTGEIVSASAVSGALTGVYATTDVPAESYILWANAENPIGFYKANNSTVAAYRAYLTAEGAGVKALSIIFGDETGVDMVQSEGLMNQDSRIYNLAGQRLSKARKGINIVNGKKYVVK